LWDIPSVVSAESNSESANLIRDPVCVLEGNSKKVTFTKFNSVADHVLATGCSDGTVRTWDVANRKYLSNIDCKDVCQSLEWDFFGTQLCGVFKDKVIRVLDPRSQRIVNESSNSHRGNKASRAVWLSSRNQGADSGTYIASCGFSAQAKRELFLWDTRKFDQPIWTNTIDDNSGVIYPFFDECTGLLLLVGKGDGNIRYFEFSDSAIYYLNDYRSPSPQRGFCLFPKRVVDQEKNEVLRCLKLENTAIQTMSFFVPRRMDVGSADLYPPCANGFPAIRSATDWFACKHNIPPATGETGHQPGNPIQAPKVVAAHTNTTPNLASSPLAMSTKTNIQPQSAEEHKQLKHQLTSANRTIEEQANRIARLEAIVMSIQQPAVSPSPKHRDRDHLEQIEELQTEVAILKEKVVKLMNENARLRMTFSSNGQRPGVAIFATAASLPVPPPPHPVSRSPGRCLKF
jgi:coronin-1B/1C/6